jgi:hypothetical protein
MCTVQLVIVTILLIISLHRQELCGQVLKMVYAVSVIQYHKL